MNLLTKQKQTHRLREQTMVPRGNVVGIDWEFGTDTYTQLYLKQILVSIRMLKKIFFYIGA